MYAALTRRSVLAAAGGLPLARRARAQGPDRIVVGTWGGDYQDLLARNIDKPLLADEGIIVEHDVADGPQRKARLIAEQHVRRGSFDVACLSDIDMFEMAQLDLFEQITPERVPNSVNLAAGLARPYAIAHVRSAKVILYNPDQADTGLSSYADLWEPRFRGHIGFADGLYLQVIEAAALIAGGSVHDYEPGKRKLLELRGHARVFPTNEALADSLRAGETWVTIMWLARGYMWRKAGISLAHAVPKEGASPITFEAAVPRTAQNPAYAFRYLDAMLAPSAQLAFAQAMGFMPTVTNVTLPDDLAAAIALTPEQQAQLNLPDFAYLAANNRRLREWWELEFAA